MLYIKDIMFAYYYVCIHIMCSADKESNVMPFSYNVDPSFPKDLLPLIPNK